VSEHSRETEGLFGWPPPLATTQCSTLHFYSATLQSTRHGAAVCGGRFPRHELWRAGMWQGRLWLGAKQPLSLEGKPHHARGGIQSPHNVLEIQGDGPRDPGHGDAVAASPRRVASTGRSVGEDVAVESVAAENEENLVPPSSLGGGGGVEEDGDQVHDVRDPGGLKVEVGDHGVVRSTRGSSTRLEQSRRGRLLRRGDALPRRGMEEALRLSDLASKSVSGGMLVLPGEGGNTHTLWRRTRDELQHRWTSLHGGGAGEKRTPSTVPAAAQSWRPVLGGDDDGDGPDFLPFPLPRAPPPLLDGIADAASSPVVGRASPSSSAATTKAPPAGISRRSRVQRPRARHLRRRWVDHKHGGPSCSFQRR
jgi:hypothetical protein